MVLAFLLCACEAEQQFSTKYQCNFVFYANNHLNTNALTISLNNPGQFVIVEPKNMNGITHLLLTPNAGNWTKEQTDIAMSTSTIENDRIRYDLMGANNRLVVGHSNFNGRKAYDGQCPNCLENGTSLSYPLSWAERGQMLECKTCSLKYNPNADGAPVNGSKNSLRLMEYRIDFNGEKLWVHN